MVSVADLCCRCVSVRLLPGDGFVRHQADPDVERKVYPYAWGDGHPQGFGGVAIHGFSGVALRDVDRVRATSIYAECFLSLIHICFMVPTTNRSPITVMTVVDVVGVRPKGHTSFGAPVGRQIVASAASGLSGLPVITIN